MVHRRYKTSPEAWIGLNREMINPPEEPGIKVQASQVLYSDVFIEILSSFIPEDWDFTKTVNYTSSKVSSLISNYISESHLEEVMALVYHRELKKDKNYNISMHFVNNNGAHGCLLTATFSRRYGEDTPILTATMRSSEFFKRGMMDLALLHRLGQKAWGVESSFEVHIFAHLMWGSPEWLAMLTSVISPKKLFHRKDRTIFEDKVYKKYKYFKNLEDIDSLTYNAFKRAARVIQGKVNGKRLLFKHFPSL